MTVAAVEPTVRPRRVLVVDDEASTRTLVAAMLRNIGCEPVVAESVAAARRFVEADGAEAYDAVLTDHQMPEETGLDLLAWLRIVDSTLAVVLVTATRDRETVASSFRGGAVGLLDKPIAPRELRVELDAAVDRTHRDRSQRTAATVMRQVGRLQQRVVRGSSPHEPQLSIRSYPCHEAGGDFIMSYPLPTGGMQVLVADVAGHDPVAAYTAAYFQGMLRGMQEVGRPVAEVMRRFNRVLLTEWSTTAEQMHPLDISASVAACSVVLDMGAERAQVTNAGGPAPCHVDARGVIRFLERGRSQPLGWFEEPLPESADHELSGGGSLMLWTDGLEVLAFRMDLPSAAVATALLLDHDGAVSLLERERSDDVLLVHLALGQPLDRMTSEPNVATRWLPVLSERHAGSSHVAIDESQARWEAAIRCVAPSISVTRLTDVLVAVREGMLNALLHGCAGANDRAALLQIVVLSSDRVLRVSIEDPGEGHSTPLPGNGDQTADALVDNHRGLEMIHRLSTTVRVERDGARLRLDFRY